MQLNKSSLIDEETHEYAQVPNFIPAVSRPAASTWGWLPILSVTGAVGVFLLALAAEAGRVSSHWADLVFWLGLSVLYLPIAFRILSPKSARWERIALLALLGSALYLLRYLEQPLAFGFNDEFIQWRTAQNIAESGHLFLPSPVLPIGPFYPGLQIVTTALSNLTGLTIFASGMLVIGVGGLVMLQALYLFFEYISGSAQVAGIAMLLYMAKPTFFGDTLYHYEDLAMPLMAFVLFVIVRRSYAPRDRRLGLTLAIWLGIAAVVVTHHVTSYVLDVFLLLWTVVFLILKANAALHRNRDQKPLAGPGGAAILAIILSVAWLTFTGAQAVGYLYPTVASTVSQFVQIVTGQEAARQFFTNSNAGGYVEPLWERLVAFAAVGLISLGVPFGLFQIWRHYRGNAAALALAVGVIAYPITQLIRLTHAGVNIGGRAQPYVFITVAFVLAVGVTRFWLSRSPSWRYRAALTGALGVIFIGGWATGTSPIWDRLPGSYLPYADQRSISPESISAAEWAHSYLGPGQRVLADQANEILMAAYGSEWVVTAANDQIIAAPVFASPIFDSGVVATLQQGKIQFVVVDRRLIGIEQTGYFQPDSVASLAKFDGVQNVSRIYDSGNIVIYDVEAITNGTSATPSPASAPPCNLTSSTGVSGSYPTIANLYTGTLYDIPKKLTTNISLTGIQQKGGSVCGYISGMSSTPVNGLFMGTLTTDGHIQFLAAGKTGQANFSFDGLLKSGDVMSGTFCSPAGAKQCSDYGLWSVAPAKSG